MRHRTESDGVKSQSSEVIHWIDEVVRTKPSNEIELLDTTGTMHKQPFPFKYQLVANILHTVEHLANISDTECWHENTV